MFKPIKEFEGCYAVNKEGVILNTRTNTFVKSTIGKSGYRFVVLCNRGTRKTLRINRIVATAFIENPDGKPTVNHKDCNKLNNNVANLGWMTHAENIGHAYDNSRITNIGENSNLAKISRDIAEEVLRMHKCGIRNCDIVRELDITKSIVSKIIRGITWKGLHD